LVFGLESRLKKQLFQKDINIVLIIETTTVASLKPMLNLKNASEILISGIKSWKGK